jgi:ATP-dependent Clp protease ATP-binding subunit ClpB
MTSNLGSDIIRDRMEKWNNNMPGNEQENLRKDIFSLLRRSLRPEFLNRIDEIVMFRPLNRDQIGEIVRIQLRLISKILGERNMTVEVNDEAIAWLSEKGYDPQSGARPVKRLIQREIVNELSKEIIAGRITAGAAVKVSVSNGKLKFSS